MSEVVRIADIQTQNWQPKLGALGAIVEDVDDVAQAIHIILTTPRGSAPLRPDFGSDLFLSIDAPINVAAPAMIRDAHEAIAAWEPRAKVERVVPRITADGVELTVYWRPAGAFGGAQVETRVRL